MHGHSATFLVVAGRSATVNGQAATLGGQAARVLIVAGRSATIGNVAEKDGAVINIPCMLLSLFIDNNQETSKFYLVDFFQPP